MNYLLDTNICIHYLRDQYQVSEKIYKIGFQNCSISEVTVFELYFGAEKSKDPENNYKNIDNFIQGLNILPIISCAKFYSKEKVRLQKLGKPIHDDFDLIIGVTAQYNNLILATENIKDFKNRENLKLEDWITR